MIFEPKKYENDLLLAELKSIYFYLIEYNSVSLSFKSESCLTISSDRNAIDLLSFLSSKMIDS